MHTSIKTVNPWSTNWRGIYCPTPAKEHMESMQSLKKAEWTAEHIPPVSRNCFANTLQTGNYSSERGCFSTYPPGRKASTQKQTGTIPDSRAAGSADTLCVPLSVLVLSKQEDLMAHTKKRVVLSVLAPTRASGNVLGKAECC